MKSGGGDKPPFFLTGWALGRTPRAVRLSAFVSLAVGELVALTVGNDMGIKVDENFMPHGVPCGPTNLLALNGAHGPEESERGPRVPRTLYFWSEVA